MAEVFRYRVNGCLNEGSIISPRLATRPFIEAANGQIVKGSGRTIDAGLMADDEQVIQGFTGQQIAYLRDLISLGTITTSPGRLGRSWLNSLVANRLVSAQPLDDGRLEYAITPLGRAAVKQLL
jgi:hypothetical protein